MYPVFRRASLLAAVIGTLILALGLYMWLREPGHALLARTQYIPDDPWRAPYIRDSILQIHRVCTWKNEPPPLASQSDPSGPLFTQEDLLSVDRSCAEDRLAKLGHPVTPQMPLAGILAFNQRSDRLLQQQNLEERPFNSNEPYPSGAELYRARMVQLITREGVALSDAESTVNACTKSEHHFCVEAPRETRLYLWSVLWSSWITSTGTTLLIAGLAGSLFLTPLVFLWRLTGQRVYKWIKSGTF